MANFDLAVLASFSAIDGLVAPGQYEQEFVATWPNTRSAILAGRGSFLCLRPLNTCAFSSAECRMWSPNDPWPNCLPHSP